MITVVAIAGALWFVDLRTIGATVARLHWSSLAIVVLALGYGAVASSYRLKLIARDIGYRISTRDAIAALSLGQLAGSLFFQIAGQLIARGAVLTRHGVPVAGTILLTGYERLAAAAVSLALAGAGGWYLFGRITLDVQAGGAELLKLAAGAALAVAAAAWIGWGRKLAYHVRARIGPAAFGQILRNLVISLLIQLSTLTAYIAAAAGLSPSVSVLDVAAAAAIVMLAASLPISLAGWGVRELGAIYALGMVGLPSESAFVVAVLIGGVAIAVVGVLALGSALAGGRKRAIAAQPVPRPALDHVALVAWSVPILATMAVFFQVHVPMATSRLNVNLADPLAVTGGALFVLGCLRSRVLPGWRVPGVTAHAAAITLALAIALIIGWQRFGWTDWALVNRFAGWFILMGYAATGALLAGRAGTAGLDLMFRTFVGVAIAIAALDLAIFIAVIVGIAVPAELVSYRSEGFAQNANAFALQLLLGFACVVAVVGEGRVQTALLTGLLIGLWFTGSRSGLIGLGIAVLAALWLRALSLRQLVVPMLATGAVVCVVNWLPEIVGVVRYAWQLAAALAWGDPSGVQLIVRGPDFSPFGVVASGYEGSNEQRILSLHGGLAMFEENPLFGAGLGAFIEQHSREHGAPLVIHSTPLWALAEMGIVGLVVLLAPFIRVLKHEIRSGIPGDPARAFLIVALLAFAAVAAVHDMMFQRALWLLCGAALACGAAGNGGSLSAHSGRHRHARA